MEKNWMVYILLCGDNTLYTGCSSDVQKRLNTHNAGKGAAYTRARLPVSLRWTSEPLTKSAALKLEYAVKQLSRKQKFALIDGEKDYECSLLS